MIKGCIPGEMTVKPKSKGCIGENVGQSVVEAGRAFAKSQRLQGAWY